MTHSEFNHILSSITGCRLPRCGVLPTSWRPGGGNGWEAPASAKAARRGSEETAFRRGEPGGLYGCIKGRAALAHRPEHQPEAYGRLRT